MKRIAILACLGLLLAACKPAADPAQPASQTPATAAKPGLPAPGQPKAEQPSDRPDAQVPALSIATLDGSTFDLASRRGKWVVVNFWATWCSPCLKEMPELSALDAMREHIEVIGLAYEDIEPADLREFLTQHPVVYPIAIVDVYDPPEGFATPRGLPMTYLIGPDGTIAKQFLGPVTARDMEAAIAAAGGPKTAA
jgi:thiol-disulfide isomerase/thioredoxin